MSPSATVEKKTSQDGWRLKRSVWLALIVVALPSIPFFVKLVPPTVSFLPIDIIRWFSKWYGFYYLEAIALSFVNVYFACTIRKINSEWGRLRNLIILISIITILWTLFLAPCHAEFLREQDAAIGDATSYSNYTLFINVPKVDNFLNNASASPICSFLGFGFLIHWFFVYNGATYGFLGAFYGLISMLVMYIGSRCSDLGKDRREDEKEAARTLIQYVAMLSIIVSVMIFAANNLAALFTIKYAFAVTPLILAVLLISIGVLAGPMANCKERLSWQSMMYFVVSFAVGALFGSLLIPFTRVPYPGVLSQLSLYQGYYSVSTGIYFFMYSSMITIALLAFMAPNLIANVKPKKAKPVKQSNKTK